MTKSGSAASARAIPILCRWPPENSCGYRAAKPGFRSYQFHQLLDSPARHLRSGRARERESVRL